MSREELERAWDDLMAEHQINPSTLLGRLIDQERALALSGQPTTIALGDVVQIDPLHHCLGATFGIVAEVRSWGIVAEVLVPGRGLAPVRLEPADYQRIGVAAWVPGDLLADPGGVKP